MNVTIFGATGLLGKALMQEWDHDSVSGLGSKDADIQSPAQVAAAIDRTQPDWIVLAAAYTDVDGCESNRELAHNVNCTGAINVATAAKEFGARLLLLSTDYVFDGTSRTPYETGHPRNPKSVYGKSKADAEIGISGILPEACIVRTSWVFGMGGKCFPGTILKLAATRPTLEVVDDQRGCPTYTIDLARSIIQLCRTNAGGIVHITNQGECSWFEFAREIVRQAGLATEVRPTTSDKFVRPAPRPAYSVLSSDSREACGIAIPHWHDALHRYIAERKSAANDVPKQAIPQ